MIVECSAQYGLQLLEASDTRHFKVVVRGGETAPAEDKGVDIDGDRAIVPIELVPLLPGAPADAGWLNAYRKMVEKAAEAGWIEAGRGAIRAHVERLPEHEAGS